VILPCWSHSILGRCRHLAGDTVRCRHPNGRSLFIFSDEVVEQAASHGFRLFTACSKPKHEHAAKPGYLHFLLGGAGGILHFFAAALNIFPRAFHGIASG
jgi:hypothetical protein